MQLTLRRNGQPARWSGSVPPRRDGRAITESYAETYKEGRIDQWLAGTWDPWAPVALAVAAHHSVAEYLDAWRKRQTYTTVDDDRDRIARYIVPAVLGRMPLADVRPKHLASFVEHLKTLPSQRGGTLAPRTVRNVCSILQRAFARATVDEVFEVSPWEIVAKAGVLPEIADKTPGARAGWKYTRREVELLISDPRVPPDRHALYALLFLTGARLGEVAALRWSDYDAKAQPLGRITIARAVRSRSRKVKGTKTGAIKLAPAHPVLADVLAEWKREGFPAMFRREPKADDWIVPNKLGRARAASASHQALESDLRRLGLPTDRGMQQHSARRTFVSLARSDGARGDILKWVTHAPPRGDFDGYTDPEWDALCREVGKLRIARIPHAEGGT